MAVLGHGARAARYARKWTGPAGRLLLLRGVSPRRGVRGTAAGLARAPDGFGGDRGGRPRDGGARRPDARGSSGEARV